MSELWDIYTGDRRITGKKCFRTEAGTLSENEFHMWIMVWIKNPRTGKYLVSQRSADKDRDPLKWETVAGHAIAGETGLDAALREVYEEVGITLQPENARKLATKVALFYNGQRHNWIRDSFYFETTEEPDLQRATTREVLRTKWLTVSEIKEMYERGECCLNMKDVFDFEANPVPADGYRHIIGRVVEGNIDRPIGYPHPEHEDLTYPVNYGYVTGENGCDGLRQSVYLLGENSAVEHFTGKVIAVYHRYSGNETSWIVVPCDREGNIPGNVSIPGDDEIYARIAFQEQFFCGVLVH